MTYEFEYILHLVSMAAQGLPPKEPVKPLSWERLFAKATEQTVFALVASAVKSFFQDFPPQQRDMIKRRLYSTIVAEERRQIVILELLDRFTAQRIPCAVLKGCSLAALYHTPALRESGDVDLYVGKENEDKAIALLRHEGVSIRKRNPMQHESAGEHPEIGPIEIHAYLFREEDRKLWFVHQGSSAPLKDFHQQPTQNGSFLPVLAPQDNAEFLCFHFIKHFIRERCDVRSILDIGIFLSTHCKEVDFEQLWHRLKECQYDGILQAALTVCVHYMGISPTCFPGYVPVSEQTLQMFLNDVEERGVSNRSTCSASLQVYETYLFSVRRKRARYWQVKRTFCEGIYALIPSKETLLRRFPYIENHLWMLPITWLYYLITGICKAAARLFMKSEIHTSSAASSSRIDLFKKLQIMK